MIFFVLLFILLFIIITYSSKAKPAAPFSFIIPDPLKVNIKPANWKGTPVDNKGRFINIEYPFYRDYLNILKWIPGHALNLLRNKKLKFPVDYLRYPEILCKNETLIWLGHASFFLRISNINILIDPHFNNAVIYKRHTDNPVEPALFRNIQYILLSHDHPDHCDKKSLQLLVKNNPEVTFLCGLNMDTLLQSLIPQKVNTITAEWYQQFLLPGSAKIYFVPSRHYCERLGLQFNGRLWGGFVISFKHSSGHFKTIYYGGDSGYGSHFKEVMELYRPGLAILPIGSYMPRWFMEPNHMCPEETLQAFEDCGAKQMIPMHYGTFNLSNEDMAEPLSTLTKLSLNKNVICLRPGQILSLFKDCPHHVD